MKRLLLFIAIFLAFALCAKAQDTFIGGGIAPAFTAAHGPLSFKNFNPNSYPIGFYGEAGLGLGHGFQVRALGEYYNKALYPTLFNNNLSKNEIRLRPELRWWRGRQEARFRVFIAGGIDLYRQGQTDQDVFSAIFNPEVVKSGLNPLLILGLRIKQRHEVYYTQIFKDDFSGLNDRGVNGYRLGYFYYHPLSSHIDAKVGAEGDYTGTTTCCVNVGQDTPRRFVDGGNVFVLKIRAGFIFK
jgi:hypothetical protein